jgi:membrane fusion protein (multidrug efflux system)
VNKIVKLMLVLVILAGAATGGYYWWQHSQAYRTTENAYINADIVQVAAEVSGPVVAVHVKEGDLVKAGQTLLDIDPAPFQVALEQAQAKLAQAGQDNHQDQTDVSSNAAAVNQAEVLLANARSTAERLHATRQQGYVSQQDDDNAQAQVREAEAALAQAKAHLAGAQTKAGFSGKATPALLAARAAVDQARLDLSHTHVIASKDGWITNMTLVPGTAIVPGAPLFSLIVQGSFWVDANFKETELPGIHSGQLADVHIDMLPGQTYAGTVGNIGYGTGAAFSLLPAQNATGNWVKVTQRVPVRIHLTGTDAAQPFRVGASAQVTVRMKT